MATLVPDAYLYAKGKWICHVQDTTPIKAEDFADESFKFNTAPFMCSVRIIVIF